MLVIHIPTKSIHSRYTNAITHNLCTHAVSNTTWKVPKMFVVKENYCVEIYISLNNLYYASA